MYRLRFRLVMLALGAGLVGVSVAGGIAATSPVHAKSHPATAPKPDPLVRLLGRPAQVGDTSLFGPVMRCRLWPEGKNAFVMECRKPGQKA